MADYTVIKRDREVVQIMAGKPSDQIKKWVEELNENPLSRDTEWSWEEQYSNKPVWELNKFLFGDND
jgi:thymidylate synthase